MKHLTTKIAEDFSAAAAHYDKFADIQRQVVDKLHAGLVGHDIKPDAKILDAGAGTGYAMRENWIAMDLAEGMCRTVPQSICADMQSLPFASDAFDGIFSSLALQWLNSPDDFFKEASRCTKDNGMLCIGTLGPNTFHELRQAFTGASLTPPLLEFSSLSQLTAMVEKNGWQVKEATEYELHSYHENFKDILLRIKGLGARNKVKIQGGLRSKNWLAQLEKCYPHHQNTGELRTTWHIIQLYAFRKG